MKKIIIFGATGNLGAYFVQYCIDNMNSKEFQLVAVGRKRTDYFTKKGIKYCRVDINNIDQFNTLPKRNIHAVVNLAAELPAYMKGYKPELYLKTNIIGAFNILEYCRLNKADRILYTQTFFDLSGYFDKVLLLKPDMLKCYHYKGDHAVYVISKNTAVELIEHYFQEYNLKSFIFRCPTIYLYTPNQYYYVDGKRRIIAYRHLINQAIAGKPIEIWGDPEKAKDIVYVKDFCQMLFKALFVNRTNGLYNVGTGVPVCLKEQIEGIIKVFCPEDKKSDIIFCPEKPYSRSYIMDIDNVKKELGYEPIYNYIDYLKDFKKEMDINRFADLWSY